MTTITHMLYTVIDIISTPKGSRDMREELNVEELFASKGGETFKVALALALGIALVCSLPLPGGHEGKRKS